MSPTGSQGLGPSWPLHWVKGQVLRSMPSPQFLKQCQQGGCNLLLPLRSPTIPQNLSKHLRESFLYVISSGCHHSLRKWMQACPPLYKPQGCYGTCSDQTTSGGAGGTQTQQAGSRAPQHSGQEDSTFRRPSPKRINWVTQEAQRP